MSSCLQSWGKEHDVIFWVSCLTSCFIQGSLLYWLLLCHYGVFPGGSAVKNPPAMQELQETWVWSLGREDPLEKGIATCSTTLAWRMPWTEEPGGLQSTGLHRVGHNWSDLAYSHTLPLLTEWIIHLSLTLCVYSLWIYLRAGWGRNKRRLVEFTEVDL